MVQTTNIKFSLKSFLENFNKLFQQLFSIELLSYNKKIKTRNILCSINKAFMHDANIHKFRKLFSSKRKVYYDENSGNTLNCQNIFIIRAHDSNICRR